MTLFNPVLDGQVSSQYRLTSLEILFIKAQGLLFTGRVLKDYNVCVRQLINQGEFDSFINLLGPKFKEGMGAFTAISCVAAVFQFGPRRSNGASLSVLRLVYEASMARAEPFTPNDLSSPTKVSKSPPSEPLGEQEVQTSRESIRQASPLAFGIFRVGLHRYNDVNVYPLIHVFLAFVWSLCLTPGAMSLIDIYLPWHEITAFLNELSASQPTSWAVREEAFFKPLKEPASRLLPEDFTLRGMTWTEQYLPETLFTGSGIDWDEKDRELPSMTETRRLRILWLGHRIASKGTHVNYNKELQQFSTTPTANKLQEGNSLPALPEPTIQSSDAELVTSTFGEQKGSVPHPPESSLQTPPRESQRKLRRTSRGSKPSWSKSTEGLKREPEADVEMTDPTPIKREFPEDTMEVDQSLSGPPQT